MPPVITDPERFDVSSGAAGSRVRLTRNTAYRTYVTIALYCDGDSLEGVDVDLDDVRWLRDRFNEILGEVPR